MSAPADSIAIPSSLAGIHDILLDCLNPINFCTWSVRRAAHLSMPLGRHTGYCYMSRPGKGSAHHEDRAEPPVQIADVWSHSQGPQERQSRHRPVPHRHALQGIKEVQLPLMIVGTCSRSCSNHFASTNMQRVEGPSTQCSTLTDRRGSVCGGLQSLQA